MSESPLPAPSTSDSPIRIDCVRCGGPATNHYEGAGEYVDLCDSCLSAFESWIRGENA